MPRRQTGLFSVCAFVNFRCLHTGRSVRILILPNKAERSLKAMIGETIKRFRKAKGMSQEELAVKLNVVRQTVSKWETGGSLR